MNKHHIVKTSPFSGEVNSMVIEMNYDDYQNYLNGGVNIQDALPYLTADEREFIKTGITPQEWEETFGCE